MPEKFVVPQFIESEDKILGPITVRQFLLCLGGTLVVFIEYKMLELLYFILTGLPTILVVVIFAFVKINGAPFHIFFANATQTSVRAKLRVWNKELNNAELKALMKKPPEMIAEAARVKPRPESTRLRDLALTVNTGGVYNVEEEEKWG